MKNTRYGQPQSAEHSAKAIAQLRAKWKREGAPSYNELHERNVAGQALQAIAQEREAEVHRRAAQELREMGEPEAALICEAGLQFPSD